MFVCNYNNPNLHKIENFNDLVYYVKNFKIGLFKETKTKQKDLLIIESIRPENQFQFIRKTKVHGYEIIDHSAFLVGFEYFTGGPYKIPARGGCVDVNLRNLSFSYSNLGRFTLSEILNFKTKTINWLKDGF